MPPQHRATVAVRIAAGVEDHSLAADWGRGPGKALSACGDPHASAHQPPTAMSQVQQVRKQVEQLRREAAAPRVPVSKAAGDLKRFVEEHQADDILVVGFASQKENPWKEKSSCNLL